MIMSMGEAEVVNLRPDLFNAAIFGVPFVDCLTTMLDDTIPLTVIEVSLAANKQISLSQHGDS